LAFFSSLGKTKTDIILHVLNLMLRIYHPASVLDTRLSLLLVSCFQTYYLGELGWGDVDWIGLAKDRNRWRAVVNSVLNLRVL
jgi:hypothetical protein